MNLGVKQGSKMAKNDENYAMPYPTSEEPPGYLVRNNNEGPNTTWVSVTTWYGTHAQHVTRLPMCCWMVAPTFEEVSRALLGTLWMGTDNSWRLMDVYC